MKTNHLKFYAQMTIVSVLGVIGLIAISGEPAMGSNFIAVMGFQVAVCAVCWIAAWRLWVRWSISRKARLF